MRTITLDAAHWTDVSNLYNALLGALGAQDWHGMSVDALVDSMIWGGINDVDPPYEIDIVNTRCLPDTMRHEVELTKAALDRACMEFKTRKGHDVGVIVNVTL